MKRFLIIILGIFLILANVSFGITNRFDYKNSSNSYTFYNKKSSFINPSAGWATALTSIVVRNGKYYAEYTISNAARWQGFGVVGTNEDTSGAYFIGQNANGCCLFDHRLSSSYQTYCNGLSQGWLFLIPAPQNGDIMQIAFDAGTREIWFGVNNTWLSTLGASDPATGLNPTHTIAADNDWLFGVSSLVINTAVNTRFRPPFNYPIPAGFKPLTKGMIITYPLDDNLP